MAAVAESEPVYDKTWTNVRLINRGEFGEEVHEVLTDRKRTCAAKTIRLPVQLGKSDDLAKVDSAIGVLKHLCNLRHDNIIKFYDIFVREDSTVAVLMEMWSGKTLYEFINGDALPVERVQSLTKQICSALNYLHSGESPVIHRQINCRTIMVSAGGDQAKLIDFGLAIRLLATVPHHISANLRGDIHFMAPELFLTEEAEQALYSWASDIWAFGCTVYQMATGTRPHSDCRNMLAIGRRIHHQGAPPLPDNCPDALKGFYRKCVVREKKARMTAGELLKHRFISTEAASDDKDSPGATGPITGTGESSLTKGQAELPHELYKVTSPQGYCLVINIESYSRSAKPRDRLEAQNDTERIKSLFEKLQFQVVVPTITKSADIWSTLHDTARSEQLSEHGCFVCFVIGRGTSGLICTSDGEEIEIRDIAGRFRGNQCPGLKGKPKLFFIQTLQPPEDQDPIAESSLLEETSFRLREPDFLLCSTADDPSKTSFIQTLCAVIDDKAFSHDHVENIVTEVNKRLGLPPLEKKDTFCSCTPESVSNLSKMYRFSTLTEESLPESPAEWSADQLTQECDSQADPAKTYGPMEQTLLTIAANKGRQDLVSHLLKIPSLSAVSAQDVRGRTAISWAALNGHCSVLSAFENAFASDSDTLKTVVNIGDHLKQTPIIVAAKNNQTAVLNQLRRMGADVNSQDSMKFSALAYAAKLGFEDTVSGLIDLGADPMQVDFSGNSPVIWAARCGHSGVLKLLGDHLSDVDHWRLRGERKLNAQEWAKLCEHIDCAVLIQDIIQRLSSQTTAPTAPANESSGGDNEGPPSPNRSGRHDGREEESNRQDQRDASGGAAGGSESSASSAKYPMSRASRGVAMIINIYAFPQNPRLQRRDGSMQEMQEHGLYQCFARLGFNCRQYVNVGSRFFANLLTVDCTEEDYENSDAFLLCIMSHGEQGCVYAQDGVRVSLDAVFSQFRLCPALRNKPKIFIVQACREIAEDRFVARRAGELNAGIHEDCLYIYSVVKRNLSFRDAHTGGCFTGALRLTVLNDFDLVTEEFVSVLCRVIGRVAEATGGLQIPCFRSTLKRSLSFPPLRG